MKTPDLITLAHGNGGKLGHDLVREIFAPAFANRELDEMADGALLSLDSEGCQLVFSTDSHVITPRFFPGGDIGKLSVTGTVNDLAVMGARPLYLSAGFIIEDGFSIEELRRIATSMAETAREAGVKIVTGDTKVVEKGAADGLFINTSGIGIATGKTPAGSRSLKPGDHIIVSGTVGDHGIAIYSAREGINFQTDLKSDCACIAALAGIAMELSSGVRVMRDPTRGGLATTLNEFVEGRDVGIEIDELAVPVRREVRAACELLGFDPLYVANEGKLVLVVDAADSGKIVEALRAHELGRSAAVIGCVSKRAPGRVVLNTTIGGARVVDMLVGDMLPRIC